MLRLYEKEVKKEISAVRATVSKQSDNKKQGGKKVNEKGEKKSGNKQSGACCGYRKGPG
jgi:hypothetical protein